MLRCLRKTYNLFNSETMYVINQNILSTKQLIISMHYFSDSDLNHNQDSCFFTKLLHECSMDAELDSDSYNIEIQESSFLKPINNFQNQCQNKIATTTTFMEHMQQGYEEMTEIPETNLIRAKSVRLQQQRKINNFIEVFGTLDITDKKCRMKTFSPTKRKKIAKAKK